MKEQQVSDPKQQPHLRAVPVNGGHRVPGGLGDPVADVAATPAESAAAEGVRTSSPLANAGSSISQALARGVAEPIAHAGMAVVVGVAGAGVGGLTGKTWTSAGVGAGVNLFLWGLGGALLGRERMTPMLRWAYFALSLLGGAGAGYALWAGAGTGARRR